MELIEQISNYHGIGMESTESLCLDIISAPSIGQALFPSTNVRFTMALMLSTGGISKFLGISDGL